MPRTAEIQVFKYAELDDKAKERARSYWLEHCFDFRWHSCDVIEDFIESLAFLGFSVERKDVSYSGFWNQGDGASFTGGWSPNSRKPLPTDEAWRIEQLGAKEVEYFQGIALTEEQEDASVGIKRTGSRYSHENSVSFYFHDGFPEDQEDEFESRARALMQQLYSLLEKEYDYQTSEEQMIEDFEANEHEFHVDGRRFP